jgi:glycosyltransferase involved in cell wall biosynthesis
VADRRYRVLAIASHPVQYMSPIFRRMAQHPQIDLQVAYCTLRGAEEGYDSEFGTNVKWDVPVLDGYAWVHVPNEGSGDESFLGLNNPGLWKLIRNGRFDAVLVFTGYRRASFWIARVRAWLSGVPFLFGTDAVSLESRDSSAWKRGVKKFFWPLLYRLATQVIVPSSASRALMISLGIPAERVTLTPYSVDNEWWFSRSAKVDRNAVRRSWNVPLDATVILFCAKLQPWKRPMDLLRAFAEAHLENAFLVFVGTGRQREELEKTAAALGISYRLRFLGFVNQSALPAVYTASDLMVLPSDYEPFAVVVNEAFCCGCPAVVSDRVGAGRDLVAPVDPSLIFPSGDVEALREILNSLCRNRDSLLALRHEVRNRVSHWSPEENIAATIEAIRIACKSKENRRGDSP